MFEYPLEIGENRCLVCFAGVCQAYNELGFHFLLFSRAFMLRLTFRSLT